MPSLVNAVTLLNLAASVFGSPTKLRRQEDILEALPEKASDLELKFQPYLDFDKDSCYNTAAIAPDGTINEGDDATGTESGDCRDLAHLENSNAYSRSRCNNGICAVMYEYYFEKDQVQRITMLWGHKHEWENVVVFSRQDSDEIIHVAPSGHGKYMSGDNPLFKDNTHPYIVYHKHGPSAHVFRIAAQSDIDGPENHSDSFYRSPLVGWDNWPEGRRDQLMTHEWGSNKGGGKIMPKIRDEDFGDFLQKAAGDSVPGFDPHAEN